MCRIVLGTASTTADCALSQIAPEVGARQTVDKEVDAVVAEEHRSGDVHPAARSVVLRRVIGQLEYTRLGDAGALQEPDVVGTPGDEKRNVEDNERGLMGVFRVHCDGKVFAANDYALVVNCVGIFSKSPEERRLCHAELENERGGNSGKKKCRLRQVTARTSNFSSMSEGQKCGQQD